MGGAQSLAGDNMRKSTQILIGNGLDEFADLVKKYHGAGKIVVISDEQELALDFAKKMGVCYSISIYRATQEFTLDESVRFVVGIGDVTVINAVKSKILPTSKFAFFAQNYDYRFLYDFDGKLRFPEFVYFDENLIKKDNVKFLARTYVSTFELYTECAMYLMHVSFFPYTDNKLKGVVDAVKKLLLGYTEKEEYYKEVFRLNIKMIDALNERNVKSLVTDKCASIYGRTVGERFLITYFINIFITNFTKRRFRDILIPSRAPVSNQPCAQNVYVDKSALMTEEEVRCVCNKIKFLVSLPSLDVDFALGALINAVDGDCPLLAIIKNKGIMEELAYERLKQG